MADIATYAGDTTVVDYVVTVDGAAVNLTGLTLRWAARRNYGDAVPVIAKETGQGITHTDPPNGKAQLKFVRRLTPEEASRAQQYHQLCRTLAERVPTGLDPEVRDQSGEQVPF